MPLMVGTVDASYQPTDVQLCSDMLGVRALLPALPNFECTLDVALGAKAIAHMTTVYANIE